MSVLIFFLVKKLLIEYNMKQKTGKKVDHYS
jgi:hypothetical protein